MDKFIRAVMHIPVGLGVVAIICLPILLGFPTLLCLALIVVGSLAGLSFLVYQIMQDWRKGDKSFKDVIGFVEGLFIGAILGFGCLFYRIMSP